MDKINYMTKEGLEKLKEEYQHLVSVERPAISQQIAEARDKGDLSENAEYDAAKEAQGLLEMKIAQLQNTIRNSRVLDESILNSDTIQIFNKVEIKNVGNGAVMEYTIVSESEADLKNKKLSVTTPIAKALLGCKVGDVVDVQAPAGIVKFEVVSISV